MYNHSKGIKYVICVFICVFCSLSMLSLSVTKVESTDLPYYTNLEYFAFAERLKDSSTGEWQIKVKERGQSKNVKVTRNGLEMKEDEYKRERKTVTLTGYKNGNTVTYQIMEVTRYYKTNDYTSASLHGGIKGTANCKNTNKAFSFYMQI